MGKFQFAVIVVFTALAVSSCGSSAPADSVNVFNGTDFHGHTFPGATTPYGMVQLSPDTRTYGWDGCSGYHYSDTAILGFSHTHLSGTGCADLGDFLFVPGLDEVKALPFSHAGETAFPGYYKVKTSAGVTVELTASPHVGVQKYSFTGKGTPKVMVDALHVIGHGKVKVSDLSVEGENEISGHRLVDNWAMDRNIYFSSVFSVPFASCEETEPGKLLLAFPEGTKEIVVFTGLSANGIAEAKANRETETAGRSFEDVLALTVETWDASLSCIQVEGGPVEQFYTCLYHTCIVPTNISDCGEEPFYSTLSIWDTFRSWNPLQTIVNPNLTGAIVNSMLQMYDRWGELPMWPLYNYETYCMIGYHSVSVIADAWLHGIRSFDGEKALQAMIVTSNRNKGGDLSPLYNKYGYIPADLKSESVSQTLEYAYDDWCIARMAESLGHEDIAAQYDERALRYRNLFDPSTGFMRGRDVDGKRVSPFNPLSSTRDYTEAIPWQARFFVPHDPFGHEQLMGDRDRTLAALDSLFTYDERDEKVTISDMTGFMGQYAHGNEPSQHMAYLYNWYGQPWRSQEIVRSLLEEMYSTEPDGVCGNEDCGQMSAWYVLSSMGIYPACPGSGEYILSAPMFRKTTICLDNGSTFVITADHPERKYISDVTLNGQRLERNYVTYDEIAAGGELSFTLSAVPDHGRDSLPAPYSLSSKPMASTPYMLENMSFITDPTLIHLACRTEGAAIHYTLDGSEPGESSPLYTGPFTVDRTVSIKAIAIKDGMQPSPLMSVLLKKEEYRRPAQVAGALPGCRYTYHEGTFAMSSDVLASPVVERGIMKEPFIDPDSDKDHFGYVFTGFISIPEDGIYSFAITSDDGAILDIDGELVVNNDGSHSAKMNTGCVPLLKGFHSYRIVYLEDYEGQSLKWEWHKGESGEFQDVTPEMLFFR